MNILKKIILSGEIIIFLNALLFSLFSVISKISLNDLPFLLVIITTWIFAGILFASILTIKKKWSVILKYPEQYFNITVAGLIIGVIFHRIFYS